MQVTNLFAHEGEHSIDGGQGTDERYQAGDDAQDEGHGVHCAFGGGVHCRVEFTDNVLE